MQIFKEKAGVISEMPVWVCFESEYMYVGRTLLELFWIMLTEWKADYHIVG